MTYGRREGAADARATFSVTVHLPVAARAASMARETVRNGLVRCGLDAFVDDALVVTSELVTRALASGGDAIFLELHVADDSVEVAVRTPAPAVPTQRHPDEGDAPAVALVRTLTSGNGVEPQADGGRRAWARFARPPA